MTTEVVTVIIGTISTIAALVSIFFAWRAVKLAEKSTTIGLISEIQEQRRADAIFDSLRIVWKKYHEYQEKANDGEPITPDQAREFVSEHQNKDGSEEWKAVDKLTGFWQYIVILVKKDFLDEELVTSAIGSPTILGFLYPIEEAFVEYNDKSMPQIPLKWYYDLWKDRKK